MINAGAIPSHNWRIDLSLALLVSTSAVVVLTALLAALRWHELSYGAEPPDYCSITDCVFSGDGRHLLLTCWRPDDGSQALRYGLASLDLQPEAGELQMIRTPSQPRHLAAITGEAAYLVDTDGSVSLRKIKTGEKLSDGGITLPGGCPNTLGSSADGQSLVSWAPGSLVVFDVPSGKVRWQRGDFELTCVALHPQAGLFAALGGQIAQLSLETGEVLRTLARRQEEVRALAIDQRGTFLALLEDSGGIEVCRLRDGKFQWRQKAHGAQTLPASHRPCIYASVLAYSGDGQHLVTAAREGDFVLAIWNAQTGDRVKTLRGHDSIINGAAFLPDGTVASWSCDGTLRLWNVKRGAVRRIISAAGLPFRPNLPIGRAA